MGMHCAEGCRVAAFALLLAAAAIPCRADDAALALAGRLADAGSFDEAITEYRRFLFFAEGADGEAAAWSVERRVATCYLELGRHAEAVAWYERAARHAPDPRSRGACETDAAVAEVAGGRWSAAEFRLFSARADPSAVELDGSDALVLGLVFLATGRPQEADRELASYAASLSAEARGAVDRCLTRWRNTPRLRPQTAQLLSALLPGAGQWYAGNPLDGLNSLAVSAGSAALVAWGIATRNYPEAALASLYLLRRFLAGSRQNARRQALEHNAAIDRGFVRDLLSLPEVWP
jgi:tetratricopeptide (TPR) repeat protein